VLASADEPGFGRAGDLFGPFPNPRQANLALRKIADAHELCPVVLGLEKPTRAKGPCFAFQVHKCKGACVGREAIGLHSARLMSALAKLKMKPWAYPGPIGLVERDDFMDVEEVHVVDGWRYLGTAKSEAEIRELLEQGGNVGFDMDTYKLLKAQLGKAKMTVRRL
jgi:DNA polymerase-3 subunit epsilon